MDSAPPPPDPIAVTAAATAAGQAAAALLDDALLFDLEATPDGRILAIGAEFRGQCFLREGRLQVGAVLAELAGFAHGARLVLGHNLLDHDWPLLRAQAPQAGLLRLPVLDTLYLSPLAFPENPYHALVKDYKLVRDSVNDPVADARLAGRVFLEQVTAFAARTQGGPDWADLLRYAWTDAAAGRDGLSPTAFLWLWERLGGRPPADPGALIERLIDARTCRSRRSAALQPLLMQPGLRPLLGYLVTWLMVAGGNSVLPAWLRHRFPALPEAVRRLRDEPCSDPACAWCRDAHDPRGQLERWFGFPDFRTEPATAEGGSLQHAIVAAGLGHGSLLGILPTGGGKSLCYQVPALARYRNRGALTVVISPLRALMKDQVDGLNRRVGFELCGALYGDLTPPERGALIERVQLGDIAVLYVAPEQFRNASFRSLLESREIGAWVFDEAHCLSQWGHDFRPDYLYCARFIREFGERHKLPLAPVSAVTATAKPDVIDEIRRHFRQELGLELTLYAGGVERDNLRFEVRAVTSASKPAQVLQLLRERLEPAPGAAIVYCAKQDSTVEFARFLDSEGWAAEAFHGGMKAPDKRSVQERFLAGELRVICATNAFGMGIDKPDVRLVIHADAPSSLEHYLQEAGRAGRDREPADCVLLYAPEDIERQFRWGARSRLSRQDIAGILRALRRLQQKRDADEPVVVTAGELLRSDSLLTGFETEDADTRVRTALAWLEKAQLVERNENRTGVFQGRPSVGSMAEARAKLDALELAPRARRRWEAVLAVLLQTDADDGLSVDTLAQLPALHPGPDEKPVPVLRLLDDMHRAGLLQLGLQLTAWLRPKGTGRERGAMSRLEAVSEIESALIRLLSETAPDAGGEEWPLELRLLNQRLLDEGLPSDPELLRKLLKSLSLDGIGLAARKPSLTLRALGRDWLRVRLRRTWSAIGETSELRRALAQRLLQTLLARVPADAPQQDLLLVDFALEDLRTALKADALLANRISDPLAAIERALLYLHEQQVITLQQGLAVFRSAMTLRVPPESKRRRYTVGDYALLDAHYHARTLQVHVMAEYARLALARITQALELVGAYFTLGQKAFLRRYFAGREQELKIQTSPESFRAIVEALGNPAQQAIVAAGDETSLLVLAGPGAGKSRVVVHRVAYLLRVRRVPPQAVLVLCYNRNAALELRRRLTALVGAEARGVTVQTFHGLALALSGHALDGRRRARAGSGDGDGIDFEALLAEATALLRGEREQIGVPGDELRERLLAGYRHILVDEYQDIDAAQYELVAAIAGRTLEDPDRKLTLLAVGDDDQNIYDFRFTSTAFIRRFSEDYGGETHFLTENYRSTRHIIDAANTLIAHNRERMKAGQPIRPDRARRDAAAGGDWQARDPLAQGRVQVLHVADAAAQATALVAEFERLRGLCPALDWQDFAVLARTHEELMPVRAALDARGIPMAWNSVARTLPSPWQVAGIVERLDELREAGYAAIDPHALAARLPAALPWTPGLRTLLGALADEYAAEQAAADEADDDGSGSADPAPRHSAIGPPASQLLEAVLQWLNEARSGQAVGSGVYLGTAHGAKGLEFRVVAVLGDWRVRGDADADSEAERRLYYVAMTRARELLLLCARRDCPAPMLRRIEGDCRFERPQPPGIELPAAVLAQRYEVLTLEDIYLGYAGLQPDSAAIHRALAAVQPGDALTLAADGEHLYLLDAGGRRLARLSKAAAARWRARLDRVRRVTLLALALRRREDEDAGFVERIKATRWRVPVAEVMFAGGAGE